MTYEWSVPCHKIREGAFCQMNWDRVEGNWKQLKGKAREKWGKLTDNDFEAIAGKKDQLIGRIQERYGMSQDKAQKQADEWVKGQSDRRSRNAGTHFGKVLTEA